MKGMTEILVSFTVAIATLGTFTYLKKEITSAERKQNDSAPTQVSVLHGDAQVTDDPAVSLSWGIHNVDAARGRIPRSQNRKVTVAVIDTGCDVFHPALARNIWRNPGETGFDQNGADRATNGIDDDGNGFADDAHGWNFANGSSDIMDEHGHGTHIAGIIGAVGGNGLPLVGVAPDVSLMILKYYDSQSSGMNNLENTVRAIRYAVKMGADVINYSGGGMMKSAEEEAALKWAAEQGVLVVAAAGNEGLNSDFMHFYPADYDLPNILSVGAIDRTGDLMNLSNFGLHTVDIAAPGKNIYSTLPNGQYGFMTGTSQATAFATGVAAILLAHDERLREPSEMIQHLARHGRPSQSLKHKIRSGSAVNAAIALEALDIPLAQSPALRAPAENRN